MAKNILIVEDESIVLLDICLMLESAGNKVYFTDNGIEAIDISKNEDLDLVIMDIKLKGEMDGIEAAKEIYEYSKLPIIFSTANADIVHLKKEDLGFEPVFIKKPFNDETLLKVVEGIFDE